MSCLRPWILGYIESQFGQINVNGNKDWDENTECIAQIMDIQQNKENDNNNDIIIIISDSKHNIKCHISSLLFGRNRQFFQENTFIKLTKFDLQITLKCIYFIISNVQFLAIKEAVHSIKNTENINNNKLIQLCLLKYFDSNDINKEKEDSSSSLPLSQSITPFTFEHEIFRLQHIDFTKCDISENQEIKKNKEGTPILSQSDDDMNDIHDNNNEYGGNMKLKRKKRKNKRLRAMLENCDNDEMAMGHKEKRRKIRHEMIEKQLTDPYQHEIGLMDDDNIDINDNKPIDPLYLGLITRNDLSKIHNFFIKIGKELNKNNNNNPNNPFRV